MIQKFKLMPTGTLFFILLLIILLCYFGTSCVILRAQRDNLKYQLANILTNEIILRDTIHDTQLDTIFIEAPEMHSRKFLYDTLIVLLYDTIKLPREQIYYKEDSLYEAWVSGVFPRLDSININIKNDVTEVYTIKTVNNIIYKKKRWSVGPYIGVLI